MTQYMTTEEFNKYLYNDAGGECVSQRFIETLLQFPSDDIENVLMFHSSVMTNVASEEWYSHKHMLGLARRGFVGQMPRAATAEYVLKWQMALATILIGPVNSDDEDADDLYDCFFSRIHPHAATIQDVRSEAIAFDERVADLYWIRRVMREWYVI